MSKHNRYTDTDAAWYGLLAVLLLLGVQIGFIAYRQFTETPEERIERYRERMCIDACELRCLEQANEQ